MRTLLAFLFVLGIYKPCWAEAYTTKDSEILPSSPPQTILSRYQTDFAFNHDRGFYFSATGGPQWNQSLQKPKAKGLRFGGKINAGWFVADGFSLCASLWGGFLEEASIIAIGPGFAFFLDKANAVIDFSFGLARAFNAIENDQIRDFSENVLAANLSVGKYWWLSEKSSVGISLYSGVHGLTLSQGDINTFGWSAGLGLAFIFG
jgi:hypothetical protein